jgi:D-serine deaminase-like pyridoxal phosphate-dependent protein
MISRRNLLIGGGAVLVGGMLARPSDKGGSYPEYFRRLNQLLRRESIDRPVMLIDLDRLDRNIDRVSKSVATTPGKTYRIVVKSIPSPQLVDYVAKRSHTNAMMVFHRPFLQEMARLRPDADLLLGKPMPVTAAHTFYAAHSGDFDPSHQLQWLIDTEARLRQYLDLAKAQNLKLRVNLEIDVGLHRGGYARPADLVSSLTLIKDNPQNLEFAGFMGYDAHLMGLPSFLADPELPRVKQRYQDFQAILNTQFPELTQQRLTFNCAGSPTFRHYEQDKFVNDISAGTCLMKPVHYDIATLEDFEPSALIATPVLKRLQGGNLPTLEALGPLLRGWDSNQAQMYFGYSGNWLAENESPPGLSPNFAYTSSNQQGYNASSKVDIDVDDFIFLRPTQSEAVLLQFGDLVMFRGDRIEARWPVLPVGV